MNFKYSGWTLALAGLVLILSGLLWWSDDQREALQREIKTCIAARTHVEDRLKRACDQAILDAMLTLRTLKTDPKIGLSLALRDASTTYLCGGDYDAISKPVLAGDVDAVFIAVLAQYNAWCPTCATEQREWLQEPNQ